MFSSSTPVCSHATPYVPVPLRGGGRCRHAEQHGRRDERGHHGPDWSVGHGQRLVVAAVRGRPSALGHGRLAEAFRGPHSLGPRCGVVGVPSGYRGVPGCERCGQPRLLSGSRCWLLGGLRWWCCCRWRCWCTARMAFRGVGRVKGAGEVRAAARDGDALPAQARLLDARDRELHQRPASFGTLGKELGVGAGRSRRLVALVRGYRGDGMAGEAPVPDRTQGSHQQVLGRTCATPLSDPVFADAVLPARRFE